MTRARPAVFATAGAAARPVPRLPPVDLIATLSRRAGGHLERLRAAEDLPRWFAAAGLASGQVTAGERDLDDARQLRKALYRVFQAHRSGQAIDAGDVALVNVW